MCQVDKDQVGGPADIADATYTSGFTSIRSAFCGHWSTQYVPFALHFSAVQRQSSPRDEIGVAVGAHVDAARADLYARAALDAVLAAPDLILAEHVAVPVRRGLDLAASASSRPNLGALALTGVVILWGSIVVPSDDLCLLSPKIGPKQSRSRSSKNIALPTSPRSLGPRGCPSRPSSRASGCATRPSGSPSAARRSRDRPRSDRPGT